MGFISITKHNSGSDGDLTYRNSYDECVELNHEFFLDYDFEIKDGKPFDSGNDDDKNGGFECFSNIVIHNGKIAEFTHCDGDGPVAEIRKSK